MTGVQTCALPIWWRAVVERVSPRVRREATDETRDEAALWCEETAWGIYCEETTR